MAIMRNGMADGLMPPKFLLEKVVPQAEADRAPGPGEAPVRAASREVPRRGCPPQTGSAAARPGARRHPRTVVLPAYEKFAKFVKAEYAPKGRTEVGIWSLPDGAACTRCASRQSTTTNLTPEEIHQIGLKEVARIEGEMLKIAKKLGLSGPEGAQRGARRRIPTCARPVARRRSSTSTASTSTRCTRKLPQLFGRLPKAKVDVMPTEEFREKNAVRRRIQPGHARRLAPGHDQREHRRLREAHDASTSNRPRTTRACRAITCRSRSPRSCRRFRPSASRAATRRLRRGMGALRRGAGRRTSASTRTRTTTYGHSGRDAPRDPARRRHRPALEEMDARAGRRSSSTTTPASTRWKCRARPTATSSWPGQALGYKIGQLKIPELRERAPKELGRSSTSAGFHDEVLGAGALPLDVLEKRIDDWIARQKK